MSNFQTGNTLQNVFNAPSGASSNAKTGFVFASRKLNANNQIILPNGNNNMPSPYIPFKLTAYKNGLSALAQLKKMGFTYKLGSHFTDTILAPNSVTSNDVLGVVYLTWNSITTGLEKISSTNPKGSVTQNTTGATATIKLIEVTDTATVLTVVMVNSSASFDTTASIVLDVTLSFAAPDPTQSDEICVFAFWYYQKYAVSPRFLTSADLWISTLIDGVNTSINPQSTAIELVAPTSVTLQADTSYNLTYPITANELGLLPTEFFGASLVTQVGESETATGTYNGYTIANGVVTINVINPTAVFATGTAISIELDVSRNGGTLTNKAEIGGVAMCYDVPNSTVLNSVHADFMGLIEELRDVAQVKNNKFNVIGYYGFVPSYINQYPLSSYTAPDSMAYCWTLKMDIPTIFQYPCTTPMVVAQSLYTDMNNDTPYLADVGVSALLNVTVSDNQASWLSDSELNQLVGQGATVVGIENNGSTGTPYWFQRVCTYQTQNGTEDLEYRYMSVQLKKRWLDRNLEVANRRATIDNSGQLKNNNPLTRKDILDGGLLIVTTGVNLGICGTLNNSVTVEISPTDSTRILETVTTSLVPQTNGVDTVVYINSYEG